MCIVHRSVLFYFSVGILMLNLFLTQSAFAEDCFLDTDNNGSGDSVAGAETIGNNTRLACGRSASATGDQSTAVGTSSNANAYRSTAVGYLTIANGNHSTAVGIGTNATAMTSTAVGALAHAESSGGTVLGFYANIDIPNSPSSIAIGNRAEIGSTAPGAIAIGGDANGDNIGAKATAPNAVAIGADTVANIANTVTMGYPLRVNRNDGTTQIVAYEESTTPNVRTMFNLVCTFCTPAFRFQQAHPSNRIWFFRMLQNGNFSIDNPATAKKEAEFRRGGNLVIGGALTQNSDRNHKRKIEPVDHRNVLETVARLPISTWEYQGQEGVRHLGPMAQDFHAAFGLGETPTGLSSIDTGGVALAAIKSLNQSLQQAVAERDAMISGQAAQIANLEAENRAQQLRLEHLEQGMKAIAALQEGRVEPL